jgi:hypothetical protein
MSEFLGKLALQVVTTLINSALVMWFWNDGLVGAIDGVHTVEYGKAVLIYMLVTTLFEPLVKMSKDEK